MVKVIKKGKTPEKWTREEKCCRDWRGNPGCEALLQIEHGDLFVFEAYGRQNPPLMLGFTCPECGSAIVLGERRAFPGWLIRDLPGAGKTAQGEPCHPRDAHVPPTPGMR